MHVRYLRSSTSERDAPASGEREIAVTVIVDIGATRRASATRVARAVARKGGAAIDGDRAFIIANAASLLGRGKRFSGKQFRSNPRARHFVVYSRSCRGVEAEAA
jgi:hypothetical protein